MLKRILPSVTTLSDGSERSQWWDKVAEIELLGLREVALFLTGLEPSGRMNCYAELERVRNRYTFTIPFVHAVSSMTEGEFHFLIERFGVEKFNLHSEREYPLSAPLNELLRRRIFIENSPASVCLDFEELRRFGGACIDLSHLEDARRYFPDVYRDLTALLRNVHVGANHISAVPVEPVEPHGREYTGAMSQHRVTSKHRAEQSCDFLYLSQLDPVAFADLCAVELENSLREQVALIPVIRRQMLQRFVRDNTMAA